MTRATELVPMVTARNGLDDEAYRVEALAKGLRILQLFSDKRPTLRLKDIVALTGIPMPTAFRLVATLASEDFIERLPGGFVRPGVAVLTLGFSALHGADLVEHATLILAELSDTTQQTVNLGVLSGDDVLYVARFYSNALVTANVTVGSRLPAVVTSLGKMLLAHEPDAELANRLAESSFAGARGPNAVRSLAALREQLVLVRRDGYAVQDEEVAHGLRSIAGPVRGADGRVVAAVNIAVPAAAFNRKALIANFRDRLLEACGRISRRLGSPA